MSKDFNVAIVGGGMCGILCAIALLRAEERIQFDLFESASAFTEVGAGVALGPNTAPILEELEVFSLIVACANTSRLQMPYSFIDGDGENRRLYGYHPKPGALGLSIYRPAYLEALAPLLPKESVHFNKRCVQIESIDGRRYVLHFADGTSHEADVVIGADGIKSVTREFVTERSNKENTIFTNTVAYRGLAPLEDLEKDGLRTDVTTSIGIWTSKDRHLVTYPIKGGKVLNIVAFHSDHSVPMGAVEVEGPSVEPAKREALFDAYTGCGPDVLTMLRHIENPSKWSLSVVHLPLETFWRERVVVIGDAAHGMLPHLGAGAGQALEDGYALAKLLSHPHINKSNIEEALRLYDKLRVARANRVAARSTQSGDIYDGHGEPGRSLRDQVEDQWEFVWNYDVTAELRQAVLTWNK
ncbi:salicylate hydroxylase [Fistulina hepatica ATCC 64428]|uniref:Salicylate hydroxylase n=1 Tax=Fistulina hepatica ATCC 64428 TaxID=1128425 RepID=A0A0D7A971_9AGAR|nr:salicylate hydroxylase [Fistulina hepatica ATCC 64428]